MTDACESSRPHLQPRCRRRLGHGVLHHRGLGWRRRYEPLTLDYLDDGSCGTAPAALCPRGAVLVARRRQVPGHPVLPKRRRRPPLRKLRRRLPSLSPHYAYREVTWVRGQLGRNHGAPRKRKGVSRKGPQRVLSRSNVWISFSGRRSAVFRKVTPPPKCLALFFGRCAQGRAVVERQTLRADAARWKERMYMLYIRARSYLFRFF